MSIDYIIDIAKSEDVNSIFEIENSSFITDGFTKRQFTYLVNKAKGIFYVLKHNDNIRAYISILSNSQSRKLRIYSIAVHPDYRKKHYAQILLDKAIEFAKVKYISVINLEVKTNNIPAIKLYEKKGFIIVNLKKNYYKDGEDAYVMRLNIV